MTISAHVSLDWLCFVYAKLFEYVTCILCLANESSLFGLLDLKSKKECDNSIMDISNLSIIVLLNSSEKDLLVEPNIISST
jgi:hypothetical protein